MKEIVDIKFAKVHPSANIPSKRNEDMGFDIYACFDEDYMIIYPHETKLIPTGIASSCDTEYGFVLKERGSTGSKGIALRCGVIDSGYRDEWFIGLTNTTDKWLIISKVDIQNIIETEKEKLYDEENIDKDNLRDAINNELNMCTNIEESIIYPYSKAIAQALVVPVPKIEIEEISYDELKTIVSERSMGKLGSSNK